MRPLRRMSATTPAIGKSIVTAKAASQAQGCSSGNGNKRPNAGPSSRDMGAMENKSLNIFNSAYVLADQETATDADFDNIARVVAHEYFHNWSGDRVTCRDWFQLSLKEGFTVFRDQSFSADVGSAPVKRIEDVRVLRAAQFPEDQGPLAHPVRPDSYIEISNFYTATVYNKGAELIRMRVPSSRMVIRPMRLIV